MISLRIAVKRQRLPEEHHDLPTFMVDELYTFYIIDPPLGRKKCHAKDPHLI